MTSKLANVALFLMDDLANKLLDAAKTQPTVSTAPKKETKKKTKKQQETEALEAVIDEAITSMSEAQLHLFIAAAKGVLSGLVDLGQPLQRRPMLENLRNNVKSFRMMAEQMRTEASDSLKEPTLLILSLVENVMEAPEYARIVELLGTY